MFRRRSDTGSSVLALTAELAESEERTTLRLGACTTVLSQGGWRLGLPEEEMEALFVEGRHSAERAGDNDARPESHPGLWGTVRRGGRRPAIRRAGPRGPRPGE